MPFSVYSQKGVRGVVVNDANGKPLDFVTVSYDRGTNGGTTTDTDGSFIVDAPVEIKTLSFYLLGFRPLEIKLDTLSRRQRELIVRLVPDEYALSEVIITPNENPAYEYIRRVVKNRDKHNPAKNLDAYKYISYNKLIQDYWRDEEGHLPDTIRIKSLMGKVKFLKPSEEKHLFIMESITEKRCMKPDFSQEEILATRIAGLSNPSFAPASAAFQPFSFYDEQFWFLDNYYLNPISEGTLKKYEFEIIDTTLLERDTIINLIYKPRKGKNFAGLQGRLSISKAHYAVTFFTATPAETTSFGISLEERFTLIDNTQWFPAYVHLNVGIKQLPGIEAGVVVDGYTWFTDVILNPPCTKDSFKTVSVTISDEATTRADNYWQQHRPDSLSQKEVETYTYLNKVGKRLKLDFIQGLAEHISTSRMPLGLIDIDINKLATFNRFEGPRWGFGFHTNDKLSKKMEAGLFAGYGFWDKNWKYGGDITMILHEEKDIKLQAIYQKETTGPGDTWLSFYDYPSFLANLGANRLDLEEKKEINLTLRALHYGRAKALIRQSIRTIPYDYSYTQSPGTGDLLKKFNFTELGLLLRYAYGQKRYESLGRTFSTLTDYPIVTASYLQGFDNILNGQYRYYRLEGSVLSPYKTKTLGTGEVMVMGGFVKGDVSANKLYVSNLFYDYRYPIVVENYFQTIRYTEFLQDKFTYLFLRHNFSSLLFKTKKWKPEIEVMHNMGWGKLSHPEYHHNITTQTMQKGYFESGFIVDNIVRINYLNILYIGLGAGIFYRYGHYHLSNELDNFSFKTSLRITTK